MEIGHGIEGETFTLHWNRSSADAVKVWTPIIPNFFGSVEHYWTCQKFICLRNEREFQCTKECVILDKCMEVQIYGR